VTLAADELPPDLAAIRRLLHKFRVSPVGLRRRGNIFRLTGAADDEVRQSKVLAWMFDGGAGLDHRDLFISMLRSCDAPILLDPQGRYRVRAERAGSRSIIDIALYRRSDFVVFVENKIWAGERPNQCEDEYNDMLELAALLDVPNERCFAVFLTPEGQRPSTASTEQPDWHRLSYRALRDGFRTLIETRHLAPRLLLVLDDWMDCIPGAGVRG
jgi:hypothetical protein